MNNIKKRKIRFFEYKMRPIWKSVSKNLKTIKRFWKIKKMFVYAEINPRTMGWENFLSEMTETFGKSHGNNNWKCGSCPMETDDGTEWKRNINLRRFPTKPEDIRVKLDGNKLVLSGKNVHLTGFIRTWTVQMSLVHLTD